MFLLGVSASSEEPHKAFDKLRSLQRTPCQKEGSRRRGEVGGTGGVGGKRGRRNRETQGSYEAEDLVGKEEEEEDEEEKK